MKTILQVVIALVVLTAGPGVPAIAQTNPDKIYWQQTVTVPLGKLKDFHAFAAQEGVPFLKKHGYPIIIVWQTVVGDIEEVEMIAEFESMDAYNKARQAVFSSDQWPAISARLNELTQHISTDMLVATPYVKGLP